MLKHYIKQKPWKHILFILKINFECDKINIPQIVCICLFFLGKTFIVFISFSDVPLKKTSLKTIHLGISLVVQWLRIYLPMQDLLVQSLAREVRSHMLQGN